MKIALKWSVVCLAGLLGSLSCFGMGRLAPAPSASDPISSTGGVPAPSLPLGGKNVAVLFGGSGDVTGFQYYSGQENTFGDNFVSISKSLMSAGWSVHPLFEGDLARCKLTANCPANMKESWDVTRIAQTVGQDPTSIARASKVALLAELDRDAQNLSAGDQLLLIILTHGEGIPQKGQAYWHHVVSVVEDQPGQQAIEVPGAGYVTGMAVDDPDLLKRLQKLKNSGIKMAFIDTSCFSGGSIPVFSQYGCTLSDVNSKEESTVIGGQAFLGGTLNDILATNASTLQSFSLGHPGKITLEELWMRNLALASSQGQISANLQEAAAAENLEELFFRLFHDLSYVPAQSAFNTCQNCSKDTPKLLMDYGSQFLPGDLNASQISTYSELLKNYLVPASLPSLTHNFNTNYQPPIISAFTDEATFRNQISSLTERWQNYSDQNQQTLVAQQTAMSDLLALKGAQLSFNGPLAGYQTLFNSAAQLIDGNRIRMIPMADGTMWLTWDHPQLGFQSPTDPQFESYLQTSVSDGIASQMNDLQLQANASVASAELNSAVQPALEKMIFQAEMDAWNSFSEADRTRFARDLATLKSAALSQEKIINQLTISYGADQSLARMYGYLSLRDRNASDAHLQSCSSFVLKNY
jgi:hypothetical protein